MTTTINGSSPSVTFSDGTTQTTAFTSTPSVTSITTSADSSIHGLTVGKGGGSVGNNTAVGASALQANTTGSVNSAFGYQAGYNITTGTFNNYFGENCGYYQTTGSYNIAMGQGALQGVSGQSNTGGNNTAIGHNALLNNTTASNNTAVGYQAGYSNTTGGSNTFIGYQAGYSSNYTANNYGNTCVGLGAGYSLTTGYGNSFLGGTNYSSSGYAVTTGSLNTIIGGYSGNQGGLDIRTASNYIVLSDGAGNPRGIFDGSGNFLIYATSSSNTAGTVIYNNSAPAIQIGHISGTPSGANYGIWQYNGSTIGSITQNGTTAVSYNTTSDQRLKDDKGVATDTSVIDKTVIHDFAWKQDGSIDRGVFAQEAVLVKPSAVAKGQNDNLNAQGYPESPWGVDYSKYVPDLIVYCQQLKATIVSLEAKLKSAGVAGF